MDNSNYPKLNDLINNTKSQTVGISLRIKESTRAVFEQEAEQNSLSVSAVINQLLDDYAENYIKANQQLTAINEQILIRFMETVAKKAGSLDPETLLRDTIEEYRPEALFENSGELVMQAVSNIKVNSEPILAPTSITSEEELIRDFAMWASGHPTRFFNSDPPYFYDNVGVVHALAPDQTATVEIDRHLSIEELRNFGVLHYCIDLFLPAPKWLIVMTIFSAFAAKTKELNLQTISIGETECRIIANLANQTDDPAIFAQLVTKTILRLVNHNRKKTTTDTPGSFIPSHFGEPTWVEILVITLENLGRTAHVSSIYTESKRVATAMGKNFRHKDENSFNMSIQGNLESHSHDCNPTTKQDYFHIVEKGTGMWQLNPGVHYDKVQRRVIISK